MRSVKQLRVTADKERIKAQDLRNEAQHHRDKANSFSMDDDPQLSMAANQQAQQAEERAAVHDKAFNDLIQEAARLESKALTIDHQKQDLQVTMQGQVDKLDQQAKSLRGE